MVLDPVDNAFDKILYSANFESCLTDRFKKVVLLTKLACRATGYTK